MDLGQRRLQLPWTIVKQYWFDAFYDAQVIDEGNAVSQSKGDDRRCSEADEDAC